MAALPVPYRTHADAAVVPVAARRALPPRAGRAAVPRRARSVHLQPLRDRRLRARGARAGHPLPRRVLRRRSASHPRAGRGGRQASAREPLFADMSKHAFLGSHERHRARCRRTTRRSCEAGAARLAARGCGTSGRGSVVVIAGVVDEDLHRRREAGRARRACRPRSTRGRRAVRSQNTLLPHSRAEAAPREVGRRVPAQPARFDEPQRGLRRRGVRRHVAVRLAAHRAMAHRRRRAAGR